MSIRRRRPWIAVLAILAAFGMLFTSLQFSPTPAQANPSAGFNAANIIDDTLFYNGDAMSVGEVQSFLNQRVPSCWLGTPGYEIGKPVYWGGPTKLDSKCLKDYAVTTVSQTGDAYCAGMPGIENESAASVLVRVGKACGISPKVLLVMLEKEQSLVTDPWPNENQYLFAMGYACPDSGPNGSGVCDPSRGGFAAQVYRAAWQLKVYKAHPSGFSYKPFQTNTIKYHPDDARGCGTSQVYIENWATAALYIYTPYRPNQAALDAGRGLGDDCSSYGNRNFYINYTSWFGSVRGFTVTGEIATYWQANLGWLGQPIGNARSISSSGGGYLQDFAGGFVYLSNSGVATGITSSSDILTAYRAAGGIEGSWGWPTGQAVNQGASGDNVMRFQKGLVVEARGIGVHFIPAVLVPYWEASGGFGGSLGPPTREASNVSGLISQVYQRNAVVKQVDGAEIVIDVRFVDAWLRAGGPSSSLGTPLGSAVSIAAGSGGYRYDLTGGTMFSSTFGVFFVPNGALLSNYTAAGGPAGAWGWPTGKTLCVPDGTQCSTTFENGVAVDTARRGSLFTPFQIPGVPEVVPGSGESVSGGPVS